MKKRVAEFGVGMVLGLYPGLLAMLAFAALLRRALLGVTYWWLLALGGALWLVPAASDLVAGRVSAGTLNELGQLLLAVAVVLGGAALWHVVTDTKPVTRGLLVSLTLMAVVSIVYRILAPGRVSGWADHPNIWAAGVLLPTTAVFLLDRSPGARSLASVSAWLVVALSGSRSAAVVLAGTIVFFIAASLLKIVGRASALATRLVIVLAVACAFGALLIVAVPRLTATIRDVVRVPWSEIRPPVLGARQDLGVEVTSFADGVLEAKTLNADGWSRVQYPIVLFPGTTYSVALDLKSNSPGTVPGVLGVVSGADKVVLERRENWEARAGGRIHLIDFVVQDEGAGWTTVALTFRSTANETLRMYIGPAPDLSGSMGAKLLVRNVKASAGGVEVLLASADYKVAPTAETREALSRVSSFAAGWRGFAEAPLVGQRAMSFAEYYRLNPPTQATAVPSHAHNELLQTMFRMGAIGSMGLLLVLGWVGLVLAQGSSRHRAVILLAVALLANLVDVVLWSSGMMYFLLGFSGMLMGRHTALLRRGDPGARTVDVRGSP